MAEDRLLRIGLTGGIASGKSTVADIFANKGVPVIDTDVIAREVVEPGQPALEEIAKVFGPELLDADGRLRRRRLRDLVFADDARRKALEAILHPRIRAAAIAQADSLGGPYQIIVVPLLVESPIKKLMDRILVVDCSEEVQLARLLRRDSENAAQAGRIVAAQASRAERLAIADDIIVNDGSLEDTAQRVDDLHQQYLRMAATKTR